MSLPERGANHLFLILFGSFTINTLEFVLPSKRAIGQHARSFSCEHYRLIDSPLLLISSTTLIISNGLIYSELSKLPVRVLEG
jgi:hypothetical protein